MCQIKHMPILHIEIPSAAPNNLPLPQKQLKQKKKDPHPTPPPKKINKKEQQRTNKTKIKQIISKKNYAIFSTIAN